MRDGNEGGGCDLLLARKSRQFSKIWTCMPSSQDLKLVGMTIIYHMLEIV